MDLLSYCNLNETKQLEYSSENPLNREPSAKDLVQQFLTPQDLSYDRNHGPIPHLRGEEHQVRVDGLVANPLTLSSQQLRTDFPQHEVISALECAGNRRLAMRTLLHEVEGIDWGDAAVMNCKWKGPRVRDILLRAGLRGAATDPNREMHVAFACYQVKCQEDYWFGASVTLERCMREDGDAILALEVNDSPLTANHGYPVRLVVPGIVGARWVKWLDRITVQERESPNFYQQRDYKVLPPEAVDRASAEQYWTVTPPMYDTPINSIVAVPGDDEMVSLPDSGLVEVKGYAIPEGDQGPITRVEVSGDGGQSWVEAELSGSSREQKWCWVLWTARVGMSLGPGREIWSRASDAGGNTQQEHSQWNLRGVGYNGFGRKNITVVPG
ncbi:sulfite oxidase [Penicillium riverlandense]|uniref:sulfite oxidase n=1 Tax=Penicillium riverlandense TaxID=1903569 RepID=UPI00254957C1|nr:sulfite oxidase [Penicillium riverlandense]KAJ5831770.1 sulfite oxidase [Penicillium riverlandense]